MVFVVWKSGRYTQEGGKQREPDYNQSPISLRQGKLTTHTEELYRKNPYLQDLLSAEVRVSGLNFILNFKRMFI